MGEKVLCQGGDKSANYRSSFNQGAVPSVRSASRHARAAHTHAHNCPPEELVFAGAARDRRLVKHTDAELIDCAALVGRAPR